MCCEIIYNECEYLVKNHHSELTERKLEYLRQMRNVCSHRFGSTMDDYNFLDACIHVILPMKDSLKSMLMDSVKNHPDSKVDMQRLSSLNKRMIRKKKRI